MAASKTDADRSSIDALLEQRAQYEQWLARLASNDAAPAAVRDRVRGDYEARLQQVIGELRGHTTAIAEELEQHRTTERRLLGEQSKAEESLAEAEIRHAVGEYPDDEWQRIRDRSRRHLDGLRSELDGVGAEIARLAEVQRLIETPSAPSPTASSVEAAVPTESPVDAASEIEPVLPLTMLTEPELTVRDGASDTDAPSLDFPEPEPDPEPEPVPKSSAPPLDELAFLKSVGGDDREMRSPRQVGSPAPVKEVTRDMAPSAQPVEPPAPAPATGTGKAAGMAKTLKCNECGTLNRPTEWYCERCGAELAAL